MKQHLFLSLALLGVAALPMTGQTQDQNSKAPPSRVARATRNATPEDMPLGQLRVMGYIQVGQAAPDFTALSTSGRELTLSRLRGDWLLLVFAESREDFASFRELHRDLISSGALVYGLCKEKPQRLRATAERDSLPFELIADDTGDISAIYGLYDIHRRATKPGFAVLDRHGVVRLALQGNAPPEQIAELTRYTVLGH